MTAGMLSEMICAGDVAAVKVIEPSGAVTDAVFVSSERDSSEKSPEVWAAGVDCANRGDWSVCVSDSYGHRGRRDVFASEKSGGYFVVQEAEIQSGILILTVH